MEYLVLIYEPEAAWENMPEPQKKAELAEYMGLGAAFPDRVRGGHGLKPTRTATTVRVREGKVMTTDGPFAETREQLGGYYVIEAKDLDAAIEVAAKIPAARRGSIEIRPVMTY